MRFTEVGFITSCVFIFIITVLSHPYLTFGSYCSATGGTKDCEVDKSFDSSYLTYNKPTMPITLANSFAVKASVPPQAVVIFLHGLGDQGQGWSQTFNEMKRSDVQYIFPNAGTLSVSLNFGMQMPAWFDLKTLDGTNEDEDGIQTASDELEKLMNEVLKTFNIPSTRLFLGGFSQGGALALYTGLKYKQQLGGIIALSTWLPLNTLFTKQLEGHNLQNQKCRLFQAHGKQDPVVNLKFGKMSFDLLKSSSLKEPLLKLYEGMGHSSSAQELKDIKSFIDECLIAS